MTIYDLKLYGAYSVRLAGGYDVRLLQEMPITYGKVSREYMFAFEATVLKQYGSKQDVLQLQFVDGHTEYITLYEPSMYLDDGEWKLSKDRKVAEIFLEKYNELKELETIGKNPSIFDLTFYGVMEDIGLKAPIAKVSLSRTTRDSKIASNSILFTANVLKEYKGNKYVIKAETTDNVICYIPLFNANMYYDEAKKRWSYCNESSIPGQILKCYIKHLNE